MLGRRLSQVSRKADVVVVAARYHASDGQVAQAKAYERRGAVWTDVLLLDRPALLERVRARRKVFAGEPTQEVPGDFNVWGPIRAQQDHGRAWLLQGASAAGRDDLGVPIF